jgi:hypothetical protein
MTAMRPAGPPEIVSTLKRDGVWPQFEAKMRAAKTLQVLQLVVKWWRPRVVGWSQKWRGVAEELHGQCREKLQALKDSATRLDDGEHDASRVQPGG